jgi:Mce-associated membrane protein
VILVLVAVNAWLLTPASHGGGSQAARERALASAKTSTALVLSYNYQHLDADVAATVPHLTGAFADDYKKAMDTTVKQQAPAGKAVVEGQVDSAAVESVSASGKQITVIVFGEQKVTNNQLTQPRTDLARLRVTMDLVGNDWRIAQIAQI